jgi:hypothetical protein
MPRADTEEAILQVKAFDKQFRSPFVIHADFECLLKPVDPIPHTRRTCKSNNKVRIA